jgi:putative nucleotidyltransferase with HDIG domain
MTEINENREYVPARKSQLHYYRKVPLYVKVDEDSFNLYKNAGTTLNEMRLGEGRHPEKLYIKQSDKIKGIQEVQKVFNQKLRQDIQFGKPEEVQAIVVNIMEETLTEPRSGSIEGLSETVNILVGEYTSETDVSKNLMDVLSKDYTTVMHSINVMALVLGFASFMNYNIHQMRTLGLCALLHDVGKIKINTDLLTVPRKLTDEEFVEIKRHPKLGYNILSKCKFSEKEISQAALEHHEKLDGSGYPDGKDRISEFGQIIGFIDCYEAITNDDRPYRSAMDPFKALALIKKEVEVEKYSEQIFKDFARSLA